MTTSGYSPFLSNERKRSREKNALVWRVEKDPFRGTEWPNFHIRQHIRKMQTMSPVRHVWGSFKFRHNGNISRKQCATVLDAWGICGARERCLGLRYRGMRLNTYSCTRREIEALLDHLDQLGATCTPHLRRRSGSKFPFISHRLPYSAFTLSYF